MVNVGLVVTFHCSHCNSQLFFLFVISANLRILHRIGLKFPAACSRRTSGGMNMAHHRRQEGMEAIILEGFTQDGIVVHLVGVIETVTPNLIGNQVCLRLFSYRYFVHTKFSHFVVVDAKNASLIRKESFY